jgi:hypothetical protein
MSFLDKRESDAMTYYNKTKGQQDYQSRLNQFLSQISQIQAQAPQEELHAIMDTVPFRDLETALMMATMGRGSLQAAE